MKTASTPFGRCCVGALTAALLLAGCAGGAASLAPAVPAQHAARKAETAIQNVIVIVQQNRSFDNLFSGYPGADAPTTGMTSTGETVPLRPITLKRAKDCANGFLGNTFGTAFDDGKMDGWNLLDPKAPLCPYNHVDRQEVRPYWDLAKRFVLADKMFASTHFGDFANSIYLVAGTTKLARGTYAVGPPTNVPWGCDAPPGTQTPVLNGGRIVLGPFPCFDRFPSIANLLDSAGVSWRFYYGGKPSDPFPFNPFDAIKYVREGQDWQRDMSVPATNVLKDLRKGNLAAVSWVLSPTRDSDTAGLSGGPKWVSSIVAATRRSQYWKHAAILVIWDNPGDGNFYDNVPPPQLDVMGLGFRVPMIVVSPYAKRGYVSHTNYEFGSILKFIEENWSLGTLNATDVRANSMGDVFEQR